MVGNWKVGNPWKVILYDGNGEISGRIVNGEMMKQGKEKNGVLYFGRRNGEIGYYKEKWEGLVSKENEDMYLYEGEIRNGVPNGPGTTTYHEGTKYVGEWKNGMRNGQGIETQPTGYIYVGEWKNGKRDGQGTITYSDGDKFVGEFKDGELWNGTGYDKNGNIQLKFVNGESIEQ
jgi:hypothetical protein